MKLLVVLRLAIFSATVLASLLSFGAAKSEVACTHLDCQNQQVRRVLSPEEIAAMPGEIRSNLQQVAFELAQIWGDTILEGDFYAENEARIDQVEEILEADEVLGYRITYSAQAWDVSTCRFDSRNLETLKDCEPGRIVESGFVSQDFQQVFQDRKARAQFKSLL